MSDDRVSTQVLTAGGPLAFQHYFVRAKCAPVVTGFAFAGSGTARINRKYCTGWTT
jgi:LPPG:FO 2-phospho-L-lactate transferase